MSGRIGPTPFVGREQELQRLRDAFDAAASGHGSLVAVAGEPGIGKTALANQLLAYATERGGCAIAGHCYEEGSLSLPYLPFVEALGTYLRPSCMQELGADAVELARILPELRAWAPDKLEQSLPPDPQEARYRLFQAVRTLLQSASHGQPLCLLLEDLHDADRGTLDLLVHLARNLAGSRLLLVGTYRDVEVDRVHPLSGTLAELRRGSNFLRVPLRGLTAEDVRRMMVSASQQDIAWPFAELVHRQTEGNPLFVQEVLRYLVEEGLVERRGGALRRVGEESLAGRIPEGLRDVIGKRLSRLSERTNQVLSVASVIGREFRLDVLQQVDALAEEELEAALAEAMAMAIVEERSSLGAAVTYRFSHAFFRQTLYEETIAPRRIRLHQQVARALETVYGRRLEEHATELAEHYAYSSDPAALAKAVSYGELAARRALAVYAYAEAVRHLEQALKVQGVLDPDDGAKRCDLLLALGEALPPAGEPLRAAESIAPEALALADDLADQARASRACQVALRGIRGHGGSPVLGAPDAGRWLEEADRRAPPGSLDRVRTDLALGSREYVGNRQRTGLELTRRALVLARTLDDDEALFQAAASTNVRLPDHQEERLRVAEEFAGRPQGRASAATFGRFLAASSVAFLAWGERARAEETLRRLQELAERNKDSSLSLQALRDGLLFMVIDGRLEEAVHESEQLRLRADELGMPGSSLLVAFNHTLRPLCYLGRAEEALTAQPEASRVAVAEGRSLVFSADSALFLAHLGRWDDVRPLLGRLTERLRSADASFDLSYAPLTNYLEAAVLAEDRELAALILPCLTPVSGLINEMFPTAIARHLGSASALLGDREAARRYYEQALEVAGRLRFRPEIALTHLGIAELLVDEGAKARPSGVGSGSVGARHAPPVATGGESRRAEALQHLNLAIAEFRAMKMQPALDRALKLAACAGGPPAPARPQAERYPDGLTAREVEVLRLLAAGRSNREIAAELVLSLRTIEHHIARIYPKIGARRRADATAYTLRHNLI